MFKLLLGVALLLTISAALRAQCKDADFPGAEGLTAAPTRPTESYPGDPVQTGVLQVESGWTRTWFSNTSSQNAQPTMMRFGAWCNVEIRWSANTFLNETNAAIMHGGFGDSYVGGQYRVVRELSRIPSLSIGYTVKLPTANSSEGLGSGRRDRVVTLMAGKTVHGFSVLANASYFAIGQPQHGVNGKGEYTLAVSHSLKGALGAVGEVYRDTRLNAANAAYTNSTWALTYNVGRRVVIDSGVYVGLAAGAGGTGRSVFAGVTYALGNLYAERRQTAANIREP